MITELKILGIIIFIAGCYFGGNFISGTFHESIAKQITSSIYGIHIWFILFMLSFLVYVYYEIILILLC